MFRDFAIEKALQEMYSEESAKPNPDLAVYDTPSSKKPNKGAKSELVPDGMDGATDWTPVDVDEPKEGDLGLGGPSKTHTDSTSATELPHGTKQKGSDYEKGTKEPNSGDPIVDQKPKNVKEDLMIATVLEAIEFAEEQFDVSLTKEQMASITEKVMETVTEGKYQKAFAKGKADKGDVKGAVKAMTPAQKDKLKKSVEEEEEYDENFNAAIAQAKKEGKKEVKIGGKTFPVTMDDKTADKIAD